MYNLGLSKYNNNISFKMKKNIAIFASGSGSNAQKIAEYFASSSNIHVQMILCNNPEAGVVARAKNLEIPCYVFDREAFRNGEVLDILLENDIDIVVLAGFLWLIPQSFIIAYPKQIVNLHPALLPKYGGKGMYGHHVHEAVIAAGETESGITIHLVNEQYDKGAILFQAKYSIAPNDSAMDIAAKGQLLEHEHFPKIIEKLCEK
jgi:phosphoribosylglycinamide formyltransferase 1